MAGWNSDSIASYSAKDKWSSGQINQQSIQSISHIIAHQCLPAFMVSSILVSFLKCRYPFAYVVPSYIYTELSNPEERLSVSGMVSFLTPAVVAVAHSSRKATCTVFMSVIKWIQRRSDFNWICSSRASSRINGYGPYWVAILAKTPFKLL